jgi:hypothetical protein
MNSKHIQAKHNTQNTKIDETTTANTEAIQTTIIVPVHKKCDKLDPNNHCGILLLSTSYSILSNILLSRPSPSPYIYEIIGDHQCGF